MSDDQAWDDEAREQLRNQIRSTILGELRLAKRDHETILEICREAFIDEDCPEEEQDEFVDFAADELSRSVARLDAERANWPSETDCDRLDRVEDTLRERGIAFWQASPCCDSCTIDEFPYRHGVIDARFPGVRNTLRGYAFFIDQNMPEYLADGTVISLFLGYGWYPPDEPRVAPEVYEQHALEIAGEVYACLRDEGFEVNWDGSFRRKIGLKLNWQRREMLQ